MTVSRADLVRLHLSAVSSPDDGPAPRARSVDGICDAIGERLGDDRLDVLSTLDRLVDEGHLEAKRRSVAGLEGDRIVYELTAAGRERACTLRDDLAGRR